MNSTSSKVQVIQCLTVITSKQRVFEVGTEVNGRVVIEIKQVGSEYEDHVHSEYIILGENGELISSIENCPVVVDYQLIVVDGDHYDQETRTMTKESEGIE